jgi:Flp pilus assembly protein TadG
MNTRQRQNQHRGERGQGLVEFALVVPAILLFLLLALDATLYVIARAEATTWADQAAQAGADVAALHGDAEACPVAVAQAQAQITRLALSPTNVRVTCQVIDTASPANPASYGREGTRQVVVTVQFQTTLPLANWWHLPATVTGSARINRGIGP